MSTNFSYVDELKLAIALTKSITVSMMTKKPKIKVKHKDDGSPVTNVDILIDEILAGEIDRAFPADWIISEEAMNGLEATVELPQGRCWVIDPIDGTPQLMSGLPGYAIMIGFYVDGLPQFGVIQAPELGTRYVGIPSIGRATKNGKIITVNDINALERSTISLGGLYDNDYLSTYLASENIGATRLPVGDWWGHMLVAEGVCSAMVESDLRIWDWGAVYPIVLAAGGRMTAIAQENLEDKIPVVTTNRLVHKELIGLLC